VRRLCGVQCRDCDGGTGSNNDKAYSPESLGDDGSVGIHSPPSLGDNVSGVAGVDPLKHVASEGKVHVETAPTAPCSASALDRMAALRLVLRLRWLPTHRMDSLVTQEEMMSRRQRLPTEKFTSERVVLRLFRESPPASTQGGFYMVATMRL